jgi:hypothetical protein
VKRLEPITTSLRDFDHPHAHVIMRDPDERVARMSGATSGFTLGPHIAVLMRTTALQILNSFRAFAFSTFGLISSRISSLYAAVGKSS